MNPTPDTSDKELGLDDMVRKFKDYVLEKNDYDELDFKSDLLGWHNYRLEEAIDEALIEEIQFLDDANKDNGINFHTGCETNNGWETMRQYTKRRLEQLQDYKKKGSK